MAERVACRGLWLECECKERARVEQRGQRIEQEQHSAKEGRQDKEVVAGGAASSALCRGEGRVAHA